MFLYAAGAGAATVSGTVRARDGARLPFSTIVVRDAAGAQWRIVSGELGTFRVADLPVGQFDVDAEAPGFRKTTRPGVRLDSESATVDIDLVLDVDAIEEAVTVVGRSARDTIEVPALRESGARDVGEALTATSGVWQLRKGAIANDVVLRGLQSRDLNVLVDGQRTYGACPNHMDPPAFHVDFAEVERVEIAKGPFDVRHQGSLGGLVNVVTKRPERGWHSQLSLAGGSTGYVNPAAVVSHGGASWSVLAGGSYRRADPYRDGDGRLVTALANYVPGALHSDAFRVASGWGKASVDTGAGAVQATYARQHAEHVLYPYLQMDAVYDTTDRISLSYDHAGGGRIDGIQARAYFTRVDHRMTDALRITAVPQPRGYSMATDATTRTSGGRIEIALDGVTAGVEGVRRRWDTRTLLAMRQFVPQASIPDVAIDTVGAFADWRRAAGPISVEAGGRLDYARSAADPALANTNLYFAYHGTRTLDRDDVLAGGRARLVWQPGTWRLGLGIGHSERVAEANERFFALQRMGTDWVGNPELAPARNTGLEATASWTRGGATFDLQAFRNRVDGYIAVYDQVRLSMVPGVMNATARSYANVDAWLTGLEGNASVPLASRVFLSGDVSFVRGSQAGDATLRIDPGPLAEMPALRGRLRLRFDDGRWVFAGEEVVTGDQTRVDAALGEQPTPGAAVTNVSAGARWKALTITLGITNLFDRAYTDALSYQRDPFRTGVRLPEPGRQWFVNAAWRM
jgi:iron complex outermembrane receptor protein